MIDKPQDATKATKQQAVQPVEEEPVPQDSGTMQESVHLQPNSNADGSEQEVDEAATVGHNGEVPGQTAGGDAEECSSKQRRPRLRTLAAAAALVAIAVLGAWWFVNIQMPHAEATRAFDAAASGLERRNAELDEAISSLQDLMGSGESPLDSSTLDAASAAIGAAQGAKQDVPEMPVDTENIVSAAEQIEGMGEYTAEIDALSTAQANLQQSIDQLKQVTNPSEQFVLERRRPSRTIQTEACTRMVATPQRFSSRATSWTRLKPMLIRGTRAYRR